MLFSETNKQEDSCIELLQSDVFSSEAEVRVLQLLQRMFVLLVVTVQTSFEALE